jgi:hypothetical protein
VDVEIVEEREEGPTAMTVEPAQHLAVDIFRALTSRDIHLAEHGKPLIGDGAPSTVRVNPSIRLP